MKILPTSQQTKSCDCRNPPIKEFTYSSNSFSKTDSAKLNQKSLNACGEFLADNQYGYAVVVVSAGTREMPRRTWC